MTITYEQCRKKIGTIAKERGEYAGLPMPVEEAALVVAKSHPYHDRLHGMGGPKDESGDPIEIVNSWYDPTNRRRVYLYRKAGKLTWAFDYTGAPTTRLEALIKCVGISCTLDIEAERRAVRTLRTLLKPHMADNYEMTGAFIETSKRTGLCYVFRRLGTTLVFHPGERVIGALCLHPIAYYDGLPMGAMVPTDDVMAHLLMMRGDEYLFWKRANHHGILEPGAML